MYVLCVLEYFSEFWPSIHFKQRQGRREQERQKNNSFFNWQSNNFAPVSRFLVHFSAVVARLRGESA